jgi:hypothetical protein
MNQIIIVNLSENQSRAYYQQNDEQFNHLFDQYDCQQASLWKSVNRYYFWYQESINQLSQNYPQTSSREKQSKSSKLILQMIVVLSQRNEFAWSMKSNHVQLSDIFIIRSNEHFFRSIENIIFRFSFDLDHAEFSMNDIYNENSQLINNSWNIQVSNHDSESLMN